MIPPPLPTIWGTYMKLVTKYQISAINSCWEKCAYMFNMHKDQLSRQIGSRNLMGPKTLPTIWYTYMMLVTKYQISVINSYWEKCDEKYLRRTDRGKTVYPPPSSGSGGIINLFLPWCSWEIAELVLNNNHSLLKPNRHHYLIVTDLFSPSYSWKIAHLVLNNNPAHSCCVEVDLPKLLYPNTTC